MGARSTIASVAGHADAAITLEPDDIRLNRMFVFASVAKQSKASWSGTGLLRCARHDGLGQTNVIPL